MPTFPEPTQSLDVAATMATWAPYHTSLLSQVYDEVVRSRRKVVVLDDDPTGPQAMRDVYVLTEWTVEVLRRELQESRPLFFVLTNARALPSAQAIALHRELAENLRVASQQCGVPYTVVVRGDSTLRGHYPDDVEALGECDATILIPFFEEGGRYTLDDTQWVKEGALLVPAAQTPYARDQTFGYRHSNLCNWVEEKTQGRIRADEVLTIPLEWLCRGDVTRVMGVLLRSRRHTIIVNAVSYHELEVFTLALLRAEAQGKRFIVRSAASFVRVRAGQGLEIGDWRLEIGGTISNLDSPISSGGLVIVGSHVPKSSTQLAQLLSELRVVSCELRVKEIAEGRTSTAVDQAMALINSTVKAGQHIVLYTSREVERREGAAALLVGQKISETLIEIVRNLSVTPRFMIIKGGWTASEIGVKALGVKRAYAPAPPLPGVPMWMLGEETRFPGTPYVIFPGNVGDEQALLKVVRQLIDLTA
jgi:uncharacterized protein YgbK (DUF1537 family)